MKKEVENQKNINITIRVPVDIENRYKAILLAKKELKSRKFDPLSVNGFVYIIGPTVSDLLIVTPRIKLSKNYGPVVRECSDDEWTSYYRAFIL